MLDASVPRVIAVIAQTLDSKGAGVPGVEIEIARQDGSFTLVRTSGNDGFTEDLSLPLNKLPQEQRPSAVGSWNVGLRRPDQFALLDDLVLFILHEVQ